MIPLVENMLPPPWMGIEVEILLDADESRVVVIGKNVLNDERCGFYVDYQAIIDGMYLSEVRKCLCRLMCLLMYGDNPEANQHQDMPSWSIH